MSKRYAIIIAIGLAVVFSPPLMSIVERFMLPQGQRFTVMSVAGPFLARASFAVALGACAGLAVAVGCYFRYYSPFVRLTLVLVPMILGAIFGAALKVAQLNEGLSASGINGVNPLITREKLALHMIPITALAAGLLTVGVAYLIRDS